jgi:hypothetical protein
MLIRIIRIKLWLLIVVCFCSPIYSFEQVSVKGRIKDQHQYLSSATVLLFHADSSLAKTVVTNQDGEFIFHNVVPGLYRVSTSLLGYSKFFSDNFLIRNEDVILPDLMLSEISTELNAVTVKAKKPLFEQKIDRLIVNVQSSITSSGNTVLDILQKSPGITVNKQNNTISMNGKAGVKVMLNGKLIELPLDVVIQMLDGMSASNVERIELITTPPAKYDAEGNAGIIHIVMKGNAEMGTNGSVGFTLGYRWAETLGGNFNVNHREKKFGFFIDYSILRNHNLHLFKMTKQSVHNGFVQTVNDDSHRENVTMQQNLNAGAEWKLDKNTILNFSVTGYRRNWDMTAFTNDNDRVSADTTVITETNIHESNIWQSATIGMGLQTKLNSKTEISLNLDYLYYHNNNPSVYDNKSFFENSNVSEISNIDLKKNTPIRFLIGSADYKYVYSSSLSLEAGVKAVTSNLDNNVLVQHLENGTWVIDRVFTSYSNLSEQVDAAYISTKWLPGRQWQINAGLRYEYTNTSIGTPTQKDLIHNKYGYFFPGVSLRKDLANNKDFQFSYAKRITRPTYNDIAPFVFFWGPNSFSSGNTTLLPAISDGIKAGYHVKKWIVSLQFTHSKHEISFFQPENDSLNNLIYRSQNLKYLNTLAVTNAWSFDIAPWWEVQTNLTAQYLVAQTSYLKNDTRLHNYGLNVNATNSIKLPKDFAIEISGMYQSRSLWGISEFLAVSSLNAGVQKKIGKGILRFSIDDIFNKNNWRIKTNVPENNLYAYFDYDFHSRYARLTYTRSFGNNKLNSIKLKSGAEEEKGRITN